MSSSWPRRPGRPALLLLAGILMLSGCGKKGDPLPPLRTIPQRTSDLRFFQQGDEMVLRMSYPTTTSSGAPLPRLASVELWEVERPVPPSGATPPSIDVREFSAAARPRLVLRGAELDSAVEGDQLSARFSLRPREWEEPHAYYLAVRTVPEGGEASVYSNIAPFLPSEPPAAPSLTRVTAGADGVELEWQPVGQTVEGFNVYRRLAINKSYGAPLDLVGADRTRFLDRTAQYGQRYIYAVSAVVQRRPRLESAPGTEREIDFQDRFPPGAPAQLVALPQAGGVRLVWQPASDPDVAGYLVYRQDPGLDFRRLTDRPTTELKYEDTGLTPGLTYHYRVTAVDLRDNEGEAATAEATAQ